MYYKITNEDSEVYKQMSDLLQEEKRIEEKNVKMIKEKIPYEWEISYGHAGQQNFRRTTSYSGFVFTEPEKVDKAWKKIPMCADEECPDFDHFENGCPGHEITKEEYERSKFKQYEINRL